MPPTSPLLHGMAKIRAMTMASAMLLLLAGGSMLARHATATTQQAAPLTGPAREAIELFLSDQTVALPGKVAVRVDAPSSGALPPCAAPEPFLPGGTRLWGRISIGVRCNADQPWTRYVSGYIAVIGVYYVATRAINAGQALTPGDAQAREGDLTTLPGSVIVDPAQLIGVTASNRIAAGAPLRRESLRAVSIVQQGQTVKVVTQGSGFVVSTEGKAMTHGAAGSLIQVKMGGGQMLSGVVRPDGMVERPP